MDINIDKFIGLVKEAGLFSSIKHAVKCAVFGMWEVQNAYKMEHGCSHNKYTLCYNSNVLWVLPEDIECFWSDESDKNGTRYYIRTRSGREFEVGEKSYFKVMNGSRTSK